MKKIKNILILGALPKTAEDTKLYETIIQACKDIAENISSPIDTANFKGMDSERYERALQKVHDADLVIGDQSKPSTGQGMEIEMCKNKNKPVIIVAKEGSNVTGLTKGNPTVKELIYYTCIEDLKSQLFTYLMQCQRKED